MTRQKYFYLYVVVNALLASTLGLYGLLYIFFAAFVGYIALLKNHDSDDVRELQIPAWLLAVPVSIFLVSRLFLFLFYGSHPLGYDTGFYVHNLSLERAAISQGKNLLNPLAPDFHLNEVESYGARLINATLIKYGFSDQFILYWFYIGLLLAAGAVLYLLIKRQNGQTAAFFSVLVYSVSIVQFEAFREMFWKNAVGVFLMLTVFYLLGSKRMALRLSSLGFAAFAMLTHKSSAFILLLTLTAYFMLDRSLKNKSYYYLALGSVLAVASWVNYAAILNVFEQLRSGFSAHYDLFSIREGIFIEWSDFVRYGFFYLPFGLVGIIASIREKKGRVFLTFLSICAMLILIKFIFYKRLFIYLDLAVLCFVGTGLKVFIDNVSRLTTARFAKIFLSVLLIFPIYLFSSHLIKTQPLFTEAELKELRYVSGVLPKTTIFTYDSYFTPWLYGFTNQWVVTPGWGIGTWNLDEWQVFWAANAAQQKKMLAEYKMPLLIFQSRDLVDVGDAECFKRISSNYYLFNCY